MATRRPNMPRVRPAGNGDADGTAPASGPGAAANDPAGPGSRPQYRQDRPAAVNRQKVVPLGAAPDDGASAPAAGAPDTRRGPAARKPAPGARTRSATPQATKAPTTKPATSDTGPARGTGAGPAAATPTPRKPASRRPATRKAGPPEKRLRERAELSGAIRAGGNGPRQPSGPQEPAEGASPVPARAFSGRMLALAVILVVITVLLLPSVGTYMNQRAELSQLQVSIAQKQQEQSDLKTQISRWDDPAYIKAQARNRINMVMPGERKYMVIGAKGEDKVPGSQSAGDVRTDLPWVDSLWDTVVRSATD